MYVSDKMPIVAGGDVQQMLKIALDLANKKLGAVRKHLDTWNCITQRRFP